MAMIPEADMERDPRLEAAYRSAARAEPPAHLDTAILAAARREAGAGPVRAVPVRHRNWTMPVSLAAVVVLSATVVMMMRDEGADRWDDMAPPLPAEMARQESRTDAERPAAPPQVSAQRPAPKVDGQATTTADPPPAAAVPSPRADARQQRSAETADSPAGRAPAAKEEADAGSRRERMQAAPVAPQTLQRSAPEVTGETAAAGKSAAPAMADARLKDAPGKTALWRDLVDAAPELWIRRIAEWRREGKTADADALLAEFRRRFPAEPVPAELR